MTRKDAQHRLRSVESRRKLDGAIGNIGLTTGGGGNSPGAPKYVYKYSKRCWIEALVLGGNLRLGTLYDFRRQELGAYVGDPDEGKQWNWHDLKEEFVDEYGPLPNNLVRDNYVFERTESIDYYVYCLSRPLSRQVMVSLDPAYNAVAEIELVGFFTSLGEYLQSHGYTIGRSAIADCHYTDVIPHKDEGMQPPPAICKHTTYAVQRELRMIFTPVQDRIKPINIWSPDLTRFCRLVSDEELDAASAPPPSTAVTGEAEPSLMKWSGYSLHGDDPGSPVRFNNRFAKRRTDIPPTDEG